MELQIALQRVPEPFLPPRQAPGWTLGAIVLGSDHLFQ
jgi:hypothetical protein